MFYTITHTNDVKVIGHYPQVAFKEGYNPTLPNSHRKVKSNEFPNFIPNLELRLHDKALEVDFLKRTGPHFGLLVSQKMKDILKTFKLPRHHFYQIHVHHKDKKLNYYWFHYIVDDFWDFIDKDKSYGEVFELEPSLGVVVDRTFPLMSRGQVISETKKYKLGRTRLGKVVMKKSFMKYDLYKTDCLGNHTVISESLKQALEKEGITGIEIKPFDKFEVNS